MFTAPPDAHVPAARVDEKSHSSTAVPDGFPPVHIPADPEDAPPPPPVYALAVARSPTSVQLVPSNNSVFAESLGSLPEKTITNVVIPAHVKSSLAVFMSAISVQELLSQSSTTASALPGPIPAQFKDAVAVPK